MRQGVERILMGRSANKRPLIENLRKAEERAAADAAIAAIPREQMLKCYRAIRELIACPLRRGITS
jgi:hypothetical protein